MEPQETCQTAGAIAVEKGHLGTVEQVELGFLGLDLVLTLVQVAKASTDSVGTLLLVSRMWTLGLWIKKAVESFRLRGRSEWTQRSPVPTM